MSKSAKQFNSQKFLRWFWMLVISPVVALFSIIMMVALGWFGALPSTEELQNPNFNLATVIYSGDGKALGKFYAENRTNVKYKDISPLLVNALIATEDVRFYDHSGIDGRGMLRVLFKTFLGGNLSSGGGSTVSQQLAKLLFPREKFSSKFSFAIRKIKEWIIAVRLEREYTKEEIIAMYLNKFEFINNAVGIKSAAKIYFNTTPDALKIEQSATLVGMAKNPSMFNPRRFRDTAEHRRNVVMNQMVKYGFLSQEKFDSLKAIPLRLDFQPDDQNEGLATYFREYLRDNFLRKWIVEHPKADGKPYDIYRDGLKIYTTIDSRMQKHAEQAVREHLSDLQSKFDKACKNKRNAPFSWQVTKSEIATIMNSGMKRSERYRVLKEAGISNDSIAKNFNTKVPMTIFSWKGEKETIMTPMDSIRYYKSFLQTGFMSMDPQTGYVKAWVGGINHTHFKYDHVYESKRQVGSTFKPFVYALAIMEGWSPCKRIPNVPVTIHYDDKDWTPQNSSEKKFDNKQVTLQFALALSINAITAYIMKQFGPKAVVTVARKMGITSPIDEVPSICLGTADLSVYEMVGANSTFANKGTWIEPTFVTRIEDKNGKILADFTPRTEEVMDEEKAYIMLQLMKGVVNYGTGVRLRYQYKLDYPIAGKTGTTQNHSDGWFMGITPDLVAGCWVGAEDRSVHFDNINEGQGAAMALPIWALYMQKIYADKTIKISRGEFEKPAKPIEIEMDCKKYNEMIEKGGGEDFDSSIDDEDKWK